jgi:hypothetical protein
VTKSSESLSRRRVLVDSVTAYCLTKSRIRHTSRRKNIISNLVFAFIMNGIRRFSDKRRNFCWSRAVIFAKARGSQDFAHSRLRAHSNERVCHDSLQKYCVKVAARLSTSSSTSLSVTMPIGTPLLVTMNVSHLLPCIVSTALATSVWPSIRANYLVAKDLTRRSSGCSIRSVQKGRSGDNKRFGFRFGKISYIRLCMRILGARRPPIRGIIRKSAI